MRIHVLKLLPPKGGRSQYCSKVQNTPQEDPFGFNRLDSFNYISPHAELISKSLKDNKFSKKVRIQKSWEKSVKKSTNLPLPGLYRQTV